eukprot:4216905-Pleurochrysis_carterae.AAC.1
MSFGRRVPYTQRLSPSLATGFKSITRSSATRSRSSWRGCTRQKRFAVWGMPFAVAIATAFTFHAWAGPR